MTISESNIILTFPDNNYFRFEDCDGYKNIPNNFKEMDVCWYEIDTNTLYIIELKAWGDGKLQEESNSNITIEDLEKLKNNISRYRIDVLVKKSIDSICMFISILLNSPYSINIKVCSPFHIDINSNIRLLSIINWTNPDVTYISSVNSEYKSKLGAYAKLFNIRSFTVLTKQQAIERFDWIS